MQAEVLDLLEQVRRARGLTFLMVSHDLATITHMCERLMVMRNGAEVERLDTAGLTARVEGLYAQPARGQRRLRTQRDTASVVQSG